MRSSLSRCAGALAFAGLSVLSFPTLAQSSDEEAVSLTGAQAMELETALARLNFDPGKIDGAIDERTRAAIRLYQDFAALPADGKATPALLAEILSVAQSFAEIQATRASQAAPATAADTAPEAPEEAPEPPGPAEAAEAPEPAKLAEAPKEPEAEPPLAEQTAPKPAPAPEDQSPPEEKTAAGYNIGSVITRLAKAGKKPAESADPAPTGDRADEKQLARVPAPAPTPGKPLDGYAAFRDAYLAAQAGDHEYAARRYGDAIQSKTLTLEHLGDAHFNRANALHNLGRYDKSIADYGATIGAKPLFAGAYYNRGFAYRAKGEQALAIEDFRRARDLGLQRLGVRAPDRMPPIR